MPLTEFFNPKSIAVIGASKSEAKVGHTVLQNILNSQYDGEVYPINPNDDEILGYKAYESVLDVPSEIDIAIIVIPSKYVIPVAEECSKKRNKGLDRYLSWF